MSPPAPARRGAEPALSTARTVAPAAPAVALKSAAVLPAAEPASAVMPAASRAESVEAPAVGRAAPVTSPAGPPTAPVYAVRVSPRARRASLRMSMDRGLEVVVPRSFDLARIPALVAEKTAWIERVARRFADERPAVEEVAPEVRWVDGLPGRIELAAVGEVWAVEYRETASDHVRVSGRVPPTAAGGGCADGRGGTFLDAGSDITLSPGGPCAGFDASESSRGFSTELCGVLLVSGAVGHPEACRAALRRWLSRRAREHLPTLLAELGKVEGLSYSKVTVRGQRTRWGSCSSRGAISLNRHLLFLPPQLVRYVLIHELCHTVKSDHSAGFWREVGRREPEAGRLRKELRVAGRCVPGWARG